MQVREALLELIALAQSGDGDALCRLVAENTGLVRSVALRFCNRGVDYEDLCQIGHIGMIKAIRNFDIDRGCAFSTYAVPLIIGEIKRFLRDDGEVKISRELKRRSALIMSAREKFIADYGYEPKLSDLSAVCGMTAEEISEGLSAATPTVSLYEQISEDFSLVDLLGRDETPEINEKIALKQAIDQLPHPEREIILLRYFKQMTQIEVGRVLGMTQVTVSRREQKALDRLRVALG
ncbi:MAG: sigma-70 family RNA polymerase sigma factor [Clostridia bacterium]|nr:sigma-70 family RNA polymerase sigma factor [Clostridia bacterium]